MTKTNNNPLHVAVILDGNGRWAKKRGLARKIGHKYGIETVKKTIDIAKKYGVKFLSFFCFSTENWNRDKEEVDGIFELLRKWIKENIESIDNSVRYVVSGDISKIPQDIAEDIETIKEKTKDVTSLVVNLCINYGGRDEIIRAINLILKEKKDTITFNDLKEHFFVPFLPDPDLVIRTSGEMRLSNFMMIQCAYSELYFPHVLWPDFSEKHFKKALKVYSKRNRRFGAIIPEEKK